MTTRRLVQALAIWMAFLAAHAFAQEAAPNKVGVVQDVADRCPGLVLQDHAFTDAVATVLNQQDARWGRNGKRGNVNDPSHDALAFRNPQSRAGGVSIVDIIVGAGGQFATPGWQDVTQATIDGGTIGAWVAPSGKLPPCLSGGSAPTPPGQPQPPPPTQPAPSVDLGPILSSLARIEARLATLEALNADSDPALLKAFITDMVGAGPGGDPQVIPNHITDILQRQDKTRADLLAAIERLSAWLRSRRALGF